MNSRRLFAICILFLAEGATAAAIDDYAYAWPLQASGDNAAWQIDLTPEVYAAVRSADLRDVEVVNAAGESVPMALQKTRYTTAAPNDVELPAFDLPRLAGMSANNDNLQVLIERDVNGHLRQLDARVLGDEPDPRPLAAVRHLILDARALKDAALDSLWLSWDEGSDPVTAQFNVSGSDDLQQWRVLNASANVLAMQQNGNSLSRREIALNGAHARFLQLRRLDNGAPLPNLHVHARTLTPSTPVQPARVWVDARLQAATSDRRPPGFDYELPAPLAVEALKLDLASDNSLARVQVRSRVAASEDAKAWQTRAEFTAFRLRLDDNAVDNDEVAVTMNDRAREWRIEPATPLDSAPNLRVAYRPDRFVFLAQGAGPYRLVAGSARAKRGDYPVDAALATMRSKFGADWQPPLATLGARMTLRGDAAYRAAAPALSRDWKTWLLWSVLIGAAVLIGGMAISLLRGTKNAN